MSILSFSVFIVGKGKSDQCDYSQRWPCEQMISFQPGIQKIFTGTKRDDLMYEEQ